MVTLATRAEAEIERRRRARARQPLMRFIPTVTPGFVAPAHLSPLVDLLEASERGSVRVVSSVPPQHAKSQTILHALVQRLLRRPETRHAYVTYSIEFAGDQQEIAKRIAERARLRLDAVTRERWVTPAGGGITWTGVGGSITGRPIDGLFVADDLLKNRAEAESVTVRNRVFASLQGDMLTRLHPGSSVIVNATRYHMDDPSGRLIRRGWRSINLPAIGEDGTALWPEARPLAFLERQRADIGEYDWHALYQGEPRPRGGRVFSWRHHV